MGSKEQLDLDILPDEAKKEKEVYYEAGSKNKIN